MMRKELDRLGCSGFGSNIRRFFVILLNIQKILCSFGLLYWIMRKELDRLGCSGFGSNIRRFFVILLNIQKILCSFGLLYWIHTKNSLQFRPVISNKTGAPTGKSVSGSWFCNPGILQGKSTGCRFIFLSYICSFHDFKSTTSRIVLVVNSIIIGRFYAFVFTNFFLSVVNRWYLSRKSIVTIEYGQKRQKPWGVSWILKSRFIGCFWANLGIS